jgi:hypothetical protein
VPHLLSSSAKHLSHRAVRAHEVAGGTVIKGGFPSFVAHIVRQYGGATIADLASGQGSGAASGGGVKAEIH